MTQPASTQPVLNAVTLNEAKTRALQIDPQLEGADWKLNDRTQGAPGRKRHRIRHLAFA